MLFNLFFFTFQHFQFNQFIITANDEKENIRAVIHHIETETCIDFKDLTTEYESKSEAENGTPSGNELAITENSDAKELKENNDVDLNSGDEKADTTTTLHSDGSKTDVIIDKLMRAIKNKSIEDNEIKDDKKNLRWSRSNAGEKKSLDATGKITNKTQYKKKHVVQRQNIA